MDSVFNLFIRTSRPRSKLGSSGSTIVYGFSWLVNEKVDWVIKSIFRAFDIKEPMSAGAVIFDRLSRGSRFNEGVLLIFVPGIRGLFVDWP